jgi:hypothetical protein
MSLSPSRKPEGLDEVSFARAMSWVRHVISPHNRLGDVGSVSPPLSRAVPRLNRSRGCRPPAAVIAQFVLPKKSPRWPLAGDRGFRLPSADFGPLSSSELKLCFEARKHCASGALSEADLPGRDLLPPPDPLTNHRSFRTALDQPCPASQTGSGWG